MRYTVKVAERQQRKIGQFGEVPKLAEGTPLERVQVVNSGARVQIPPSALAFLKRNVNQKEFKKIKKVVDKANDLC